MKVQMPLKKTDISLEWSFSQRCFHIEPVAEAMKTNISLFKQGGSCDYVLLGIFKNDKDASVAAQHLRGFRPDIFAHGEAARDLSKRLEKAQEEIASLKEDNQLLRRKIENHILMSEDFRRSYEDWLDSLNVEVK